MGMDKKYQVFVSSTYEDLKVERAAVFSCLLDNNCIPTGMEQFPASPMSQWQYITKMIDISDYYLLIVGGRYGSIDVDEDISYTEKEFNYARGKKIPVIAFLYEHPEKISFEKSEQSQEGREKLEKFRYKIENCGVHVNFYNGENDLKYKIAMSLPKLISDFPAVGWVRADQVEEMVKDSEYISSIKSMQESLLQMQKMLSGQIEHTTTEWKAMSNDEIDKLFEEKEQKAANHVFDLSKESKILLKEACNDPNGQIIKLHSLEGVSITVNGKQIITSNERRVVSKWEAAIDELLGNHMINAIGTKGEIFQITKDGYEINDFL